MTVETEVKEVVSEVKAKVEKAVTAMIPEVVKGEAPAKKLVQELTAEEKLVIRDIELEYLKAQMQINQLSQTTQSAQKKFTSMIEDLSKKYLINPAEMMFDNVELKFVAKK
jgi:hypothetical protein